MLFCMCHTPHSAEPTQGTPHALRFSDAAFRFRAMIVSGSLYLLHEDDFKFKAIGGSVGCRHWSTFLSIEKLVAELGAKVKGHISHPSLSRIAFRRCANGNQV